MNPQDERITAWDRIVHHPFFNAAFDDAPFHDGDRPLIDYMIELLDRAVSLPSKGGKSEMTWNNFVSSPDADGDYLTAHPSEGRVLFESHPSGGAVYLTLKDVAALHKVLGDHLEANKRELPREGAVRFSGGEIAVYSPESSRDEPTFLVHAQGKAQWYAEQEVEKYFGTDWEELVVK